MTIETSSVGLRLINVLKLLRLVRLQKLVRYFWRWNDDLGLASTHSLLTNLVMLVFGASLTLPCLALPCLT